VSDDEHHYHHSRPIRPLWLWLQWVIASVLGGLVGLAVGFLFLGALVFIAVAVGMAIGQWLILKRYLRLAHGWVLMSLVGGFLGSLVILVLLDTLGGFIGLDIATVILGAGIEGLIGVAQWGMMRSRFDKAWLWILANFLAGGVGMAVVGFLIRAEGAFEGGVLLFGILALWVIYGLITGGAMTWFLTHHGEGRGTRGAGRERVPGS
jgi:hypothetical protein